MHNNLPERLQVGENADLTVILAHGRGRSPDDMRALAERLDLKNVTYIFPVATGKTWYPGLFQAPIAENEPSLTDAIAHYEEIVLGEIASGTPAHRIVVGGFSQGACLTAEFIARHPRAYAGAILWTGGLIGPDGSHWPKNQIIKNMPAYISTAENDPWVPAARVRQTLAWLRNCGARAKMIIFTEREHGVLDEEISAVRQMLELQRRAILAMNL